MAPFQIKERGFGSAAAILSVFLLVIVAVSAVLVSNRKETVSYKSFASTTTNAPITKKIQLIIFNPVQSNGQTLTQYEHWNDPDTLTSQIISDLQIASGGFANFIVANRVVVSGYPKKADGYVYTNATYLACLADHSKCHSPDGADYNKVLSNYSSCAKLNSGAIDEVWLWGGGWFGYWEATAAGPQNYVYGWIGTPINNTSCSKLMPVMGFNYSRADAEAIHSFGHRVEATVSYAYDGSSWDYSTGSTNNNWNKYALYNKLTPGKARCGNIHFPPNGTQDYDYGNTSSVLSACDSWTTFPNLLETFNSISCTAWGCNQCANSQLGVFDCQQKNYLMWWFGHLPKADGYTGNKANNWWKYALDYQNAVAGAPAPSPTSLPSSTPTPTCLSQFSACTYNSQCCSGTCAPSSMGGKCL